MNFLKILFLSVIAAYIFIKKDKEKFEWGTFLIYVWIAYAIIASIANFLFVETGE